MPNKSHKLVQNVENALKIQKMLLKFQNTLFKILKLVKNYYNALKVGILIKVLFFENIFENVRARL